MSASVIYSKDSLLDNQKNSASLSALARTTPISRFRLDATGKISLNIEQRGLSLRSPEHLGSLNGPGPDVR